MGRKNTENKFFVAEKKFESRRAEEKALLKEKETVAKPEATPESESITPVPTPPAPVLESPQISATVNAPLPVSEANVPNGQVLQAVSSIFKTRQKKDLDARISVYLDSPLKEAFSQKCKNCGRTMNEVINELIEFYVNNA